MTDVRPAGSRPSACHRSHVRYCGEHHDEVHGADDRHRFDRMNTCGRCGGKEDFDERRFPRMEPSRVSLERVERFGNTSATQSADREAAMDGRPAARWDGPKTPQSMPRCMVDVGRSTTALRQGRSEHLAHAFCCVNGGHYVARSWATDISGSMSLERASGDGLPVRVRLAIMLTPFPWGHSGRHVPAGRQFLGSLKGQGSGPKPCLAEPSRPHGHRKGRRREGR